MAVLLIAGPVSAASIPGVEDPKDGPGVWLVPVFNNSGATLDEGDVVVWDISSSTGDNDNYVTRTTTADTFLVAGVITNSSVVDQSTGTIAIRGVVTVDTTTSVGIGSLMCSSGTAGSATQCSSTVSDADAFGFATAASAAGTATVYVFGR